MGRADGVSGEFGGVWLGGVGEVGEFILSLLLLAWFWVGLGESKADLDVTLAAITCYASPCRFYRRSAISRPPYVPWEAVAAVDFDGEIYGSVPAPVVFVDSEEFGTRFGIVPGRFVRWWKGMGDEHDV